VNAFKTPIHSFTTVVLYIVLANKCQRNPKGQPRMNNPETPAILATRHRTAAKMNFGLQIKQLILLILSVKRTYVEAMPH
jgi:hypothetical protein